MKKILYILPFLFSALLFVQCNDEITDNSIIPDATCTDGLQNGDEVGIDCGGSNCAPCEDAIGGIDFSGTYMQEDQVGRPAVSIVYVTSGLRDAYNTTIPSELTTDFQQDMQANLVVHNPAFTTNILGQDAAAFTTLLSRDVLWVGQSGVTTFYDGTNILTGRRLQDDVMDFQLLLLYGGADVNNPLNDGTNDQPLLIRDGVSENDKPFLTNFPYLASPF